MSPGHRFVRTLSPSPIAPGVTVHSIIATLAPGPPQGQNDGVVRYESAHLGRRGVGEGRALAPLDPERAQADPTDGKTEVAPRR